MNNGFAGGGEMGALIRSFDWSKTAIGAPETWSPTLRMMVRFLLANRFPLLLWWGPRYISIYNDAYRPILGAKHPWALGLPLSECWSEIWHVLGPLVDTPFHGGPPTWIEDLELELRRTGFTEETHFTVAYSPVPDEAAQGGIGGVLATVHEITGKVIAERRVVALRDLGTRAAEAKTAEEACATAATALAAHPKDVPFALFYLADPDGKHARLVASCGLDGVCAEFQPPAIDLDGPDTASAAWPLAAVRESGQLQVAGNLSLRFPTIPAGPWSDPPPTAVILPIRSNIAHQLAGFLVAGISARIAFDDSYKSFFDLAVSSVSVAIANARAYEEERRRAEALAEIDRAKTVFFSNVSHEFRTPLTLMLGPLESVLGANGDLKPEAREQLVTAHRNSLRLLKLVNSLLDFSRIEAGRMKAAYRPVELATLTADLASNFRSAMEAGGLNFIVDCPALPQPVYVDRDMWEKIVLNLLSNAFKFTFKGRVTVKMEARDGHAVLTVADTGVGIPEAELPHIFERFHRVEGTQGRTYEGSGIGLALIQELVKLHAGTIEVKSHLGEGSEFTIALPFGSAHLPAHLPAQLPKEGLDAATQVPTAVRAEVFTGEALTWIAQERLAHPSGDYGPALSAPAPSSPRPRILLADDNADMREHVSRTLGGSYEILTVGNGAAALKAAGENTPDLILSDVMMPGLDGFGLLRALRGDPKLREVPVILLSARAGEDARTEGIAAGADDYLTKPFTARELAARIRTTLDLQSVRRESLQRVEQVSARLETALKAARMGAWEWDLSTGQVINSPNMPEIVGQPVAHLETAGWTAIHPEDAPMLRKTIDGAIERREGWSACFRLIRPDTGALRWMEVHGSILCDRNGAAAKATGVVLDITERVAHMRQFETLLNQAPLGVFVVDADFRLRHVNPTALPFFGDIPDLIGRDLEEIAQIHWSRDEAAEITRLFRHTLETGESYAIPEFIQQRIDLQEPAYYEWKIDRIPLPDGSFGLVCYFRDISAQVLARQEIARSEERFRALVMASSDVVYKMSPDWSEMLQLRNRGDFIADTEDPSRGWLAKYIHPDDQAHVMEVIGEAIRGRTPFELEHRVIRGDGTLGWIYSRAIPILDAQGGILEWFGAARDVTAQKTAEAERDQALSLLTTVLDSSPDVIAAKDLQGRYLTVNQAAARIFGRPVSEIVGRTDLEIADAGIAGPIMKSDRDVIGSGKAVVVKEQYVTPDGVMRFFQSVKAPLRDLAGISTGVVVVARDVTEQEKSAKQLRDMEDRFRALADNISQFAWMTDETGWIFWYNQRWYDYTGTTLEEMRGWGWRAVHHPEHVEQVVERFRDCIQRGEEWEDTFPLRSKEGEWRWFLSRARPIRNGEGKIVSWFGTNTDITEQLESERALRRANQDLEQFAFSASHDLQEPLRNVAVYSQLFRKKYGGKLDSNAEQFLDYMVEGAKRMGYLVADLLAYTQAASTDSAPMDAIDAEKVLDEVLLSLASVIESSGAAVTHDPLPGAVMMKEVHFQQLLQNLIGNAIKYRKDGEPPQVHISARRNDEEWLFSVRDNGIGIAPEFHGLVFGIFKRLHGRDKYTGTGIGLAICQKIVERYGGRIWLESKLNEGTTFHFTIPVTAGGGKYMKIK